MNRSKCEKCGSRHPLDRPCPANDNQPFDEKEWRKAYMKLYMQKRRERERAAKAKEQAS